MNDTSGGRISRCHFELKIKIKLKLKKNSTSRSFLISNSLKIWLQDHFSFQIVSNFDFKIIPHFKYSQNSTSRSLSISNYHIKIKIEAASEKSPCEKRVWSQRGLTTAPESRQTGRIRRRPRHTCVSLNGRVIHTGRVCACAVKVPRSGSRRSNESEIPRQSIRHLTINADDNSCRRETEGGSPEEARRRARRF